MMNVYGYTTERQSYYGNEISYIPKNSRSVLMTKISSIFFYLLLSSSIRDTTLMARSTRPDRQDSGDPAIA